MRIERLKPLALSSSVDPLANLPRAAATPLAPLLAGARARGVADGLEWLGLAAVMLDDRGEVLHVNAGAVELMGEALFIQHGRLRALDPLVVAELDQAIFEVMTTGVASKVFVPFAAGRGALALRIAPFTALDDDPFQLLRLVVIVEPRDGAIKGGDARH